MSNTSDIHTSKFLTFYKRMVVPSYFLKKYVIEDIKQKGEKPCLIN